ncbi:polysaccharide biosynthesis C-terminal domain-containing protein [Paenibacillus mendelii]|uniref:Polysaccharide biosynthesis C-terminal domain-containing protein n=1 Tax=Paenibacillus mendelii TaxID=206163 RepID=A0ABV6JEX9_9BACL|nr:polysaccharide biosynthesis C-terminal domain-containing protein [Paenibacillus mendelii]MCQ6557350.1 polysaccharide biosynthesis C-terminal domain-containing protein [Paenibacillus mendelii]
MHHRIEQALRISLIVGAPSTVILFIWADLLTTVLYHAPEAGKLLQMIAPIFILHYFEGPLHAVLLGIGKAKTTMVNFIVSTLIKIGCIILFGTKLGIAGVILGINIGICLLTLFNFYSVSRSLGLYVNTRILVKVGCCTLFMAVCGYFSLLYMQQCAYPILLTIAVTISLSLLEYLTGLFTMNLIKKKRSPQSSPPAPHHAEVKMQNSSSSWHPYTNNGWSGLPSCPTTISFLVIHSP